MALRTARSLATLFVQLLLALSLLAILLSSSRAASIAQQPEPTDTPAGYLPVTVDPSIARDNMIHFWDTFTQATDEAGLSRRYGGIHFVEGDVQGRDVGWRTGERDWQTALGYFDGNAPTMADMSKVIATLLLDHDVFQSLYPQQEVYIPFVYKN